MKCRHLAETREQCRRYTYIFSVRCEQNTDVRFAHNTNSRHTALALQNTDRDKVSSVIRSSTLTALAATCESRVIAFEHASLAHHCINCFRSEITFAFDQKTLIQKWIRYSVSSNTSRHSPPL